MNYEAIHIDGKIWFIKKLLHYAFLGFSFLHKSKFDRSTDSVRTNAQILLAVLFPTQIIDLGN